MLIGTVSVGGESAEVMLSVGSGRPPVLRARVAKYVARMEHVLDNWTDIKDVILAKATSVASEGARPAIWQIVTMLMEARTTTLTFTDLGNEDAEHGLQAVLNAKGQVGVVEPA